MFVQDDRLERIVTRQYTDMVMSEMENLPIRGDAMMDWGKYVTDFLRDNDIQYEPGDPIEVSIPIRVSSEVASEISRQVRDAFPQNEVTLRWRGGVGFSSAHQDIWWHYTNKSLPLRGDQPVRVLVARTLSGTGEVSVFPGWYAVWGDDFPWDFRYTPQGDVIPFVYAWAEWPVAPDVEPG